MDVALDGIARMRAQEKIEPAHIHAIVALAEVGYEQLVSFQVRWEADMRAIQRWRAAHPDKANDLVWPDHADLTVWLMDVFDCSFEGPTVDQVEQVQARLKGAMLRLPNQLTKDAGDMIAALATALRRMARGKFLAEERAREAMPIKEAIDKSAGQIIAMEQLLREVRDVFREYETHHLEKASAAAIRSDEARSAGEELGADVAREESVAKAARNGKIAGAIEAVLAGEPWVRDPGAAGLAIAPGLPTRARGWDVAAEGTDRTSYSLRSEDGALIDLQAMIAEGLAAELVDSYDCGRVWEAWGLGTMSADDFTPVSDRVDDIATALAAKITGAA
jgi:hypothetical protein